MRSSRQISGGRWPRIFEVEAEGGTALGCIVYFGARETAGESAASKEPFRQPRELVGAMRQA